MGWGGVGWGGVGWGGVGWGGVGWGGVGWGGVGPESKPAIGSCDTLIENPKPSSQLVGKEVLRSTLELLNEIPQLETLSVQLSCRQSGFEVNPRASEHEIP